MRVDTADSDRPARHRRRERPGRADDPVTDHPMRGGLQAGDAMHRQRRAADAVDLGAHLLQHRAEVDDLGFARCVVDHGRAVGEHGGHEDVLGGPDAGEVEPDLRPVQVARLRHHAPVLDLGGRTELAQPGLVHVQRPGADRVAAGQRDDGAPAACDQRAEHAHRRPQLRHRSVVGLSPGLGRDVDRHLVVVDGHGAAEAAQDVGHQRDVEDLGAVGDRRRALGEQGRRHELQDAVLRAHHVDGPDQPGAASYREMLHHGRRR